MRSVPALPVGAALWIAAIVILVAILVMIGPRDDAIWSHNGEPCKSPSFGPPGGCLMPAGYLTPEPARFDVATVRSTFTSTCDQVADDEFCTQVELKMLSAYGTVLVVPTRLDHESAADAREVCGRFATTHFASGDSGANLGYVTIEVKDRSGIDIANCHIE